MKNAMIMLLAALPFAALAQQQYTINGTMGNVKLPATAYVVYQESGKMQFDSATVQANGKFSIKGKVSVPMKGYMMVARNGERLFSRPSADQIGVYLEEGTISFSSPDGSMLKGKIGGTPLNKDQQEMLSMMASKNTTEEMFIKNHPKSLVSLDVLRGLFTKERDAEKANTLFSSLNPELKASKAGQSFMSLIGKARAFAIGDQAPDFTLKNVKGEDVSLASFKGKYVLIDFWASWCVPCRQENPNVVKAFEKFKDKKFTVLGVSLDGGEDGKKNWVNAIAKDGLAWAHVSDLRGWGSYVAQLYHVKAIPANFLLDPTGKIIGKDLRGEDLQAKLAEILK